MGSPMIILLSLLAGLPLLGLVSLRWYQRNGNRRVGRKAIWLAATSGVFWALLGDYAATVYGGWGWALFLLLLGAGAAYTGHCSEQCYGGPEDRRCVILTVLAYCGVFLLTSWLMTDRRWSMLQESVMATGSLSRFRGPLH